MPKPNAHYLLAIRAADGGATRRFYDRLDAFLREHTLDFYLAELKTTEGDGGAARLVIERKPAPPVEQVA